MRTNIRQFVSSAQQVFQPRGAVYEFGAYQVAGQEDVADLRPLFLGQSFVGCDMRRGPGVDRIEDVSNLTLDCDSVPTVICVETLEHVFETRRAVDELMRVLAPGGMLLISTPFYFHIHDHPSDYWRITPSCLERLLEPLPATIVGYQGTQTTPHTVFAIGMQAPVVDDFADRAANFVAHFQDHCRQLEANISWRQKAKYRARSMFLSKGERRQRSSYYDCHFQVRWSPEQLDPPHSRVRNGSRRDAAFA